MGLTVFDYALLFVLVCSSILGMMRGFIKEVLTLVGWVLAFIVANRFGEAFSHMLPQFIPTAVLRIVIAYVILFILTRIAVLLLAKTLQAMLGSGILSSMNRILGCAFGLARGVLISLILILLCGLTSLPKQDFWKNAKLSPYAEQIAQKTLPYLPESLANNIAY